MNNCKYCEQPKTECPCSKLEAFFDDAWDLMYKWGEQLEFKLAYARPLKPRVLKAA